MSQQTLNRLRELRLGGMAAALQQQQEQVATYDGLSFIERLGLLVEQEHLAREQRKQARLVRHARLKLSATTQEIDVSAPRSAPVFRTIRSSHLTSSFLHRGFSYDYATT